MFPAAKTLFPVKETTQDSTVDTGWARNQSYQCAVETPRTSEEAAPVLLKRGRDNHNHNSSSNGSESYEDSDDSAKLPNRKRHKKSNKKSKKHHHGDDHHKKKKKHKYSKSKTVSARKRESSPKKPATIWIEETNFTPKDAHRVDNHPDMSNFSYDSLYRGDITNYHRRFGNYCLGLGDNLLKFTDQRNQSSKKKRQVMQQFRYYEDKLSDSSDTVVILQAREPGTNELKGAEFLVVETTLPVDEDSLGTIVSPESYLMKQAGEYNTRLLDEPHNVQLWMEFIKFQDEALVWGKLPLTPAAAQFDDGGSDPAGRDSSLRRQKMALDERKVAIYERALEKNPLSEELLVGYMMLVQETWDTERLVKHWKDIVFKQPNRSLLWLKYIEFCQSRFSFYRSSSVMALYQKAISTLSSILDRSLLSHKPEPEAESKLLVIFILYCYFLQHSGFIEKGIALFQALIEFNLCSPDDLFASQNLYKAKDRLDVFEAFWDGGVARIGEEGALGWSNWLECQTSSTTTDRKTLGSFNLKKFKQLTEEKVEESVLTEPSSQSDDEESALDNEASLVKDLPCSTGWAKLETHRNITSCLPGRLSSVEEDQESSDVDHLVLFDDITQSVFLLNSSKLKAILVFEFLRFLGAPIRTVPAHLPTMFSDLLQMIVSPCEMMEPVAVPALLSSSQLPSVLYQPEPAVSDLTALCNTPLHDLLHPSSSTSNTAGLPLKGFITRLFNHSLSLFDSLNVSPDMKSSLACSWLQFELNNIPKTPALGSETNMAAEELQMLSITLVQSITVSDYGFVWDLINQLEPCLALRKKASLLSKTFLKPFTESPAPRGSPLYTMSLLFVECILQVRKPINCYSKHKLTQTTALFALVNLSQGEFNPTMVPITDVRVTPFQVIKAAEYFQELSLRVLSASDLTVPEVISRLGCCFYFKYLSEGLEASCQLMSEFIDSFLNRKEFRDVVGCLEALYVMEVKLVQLHSLSHPMKPQILKDILYSALDQFPHHFWFLAAVIKSEERSFITGQLRRYFYSLMQKWSNNVVPCVFAVQAEISRYHHLKEFVGEYLEEPTSSMLQRARAYFVRGSQSVTGRACPALWRLYLKFEMEYGYKEKAKAVFYQAIQQCPWVKVLYFDGAQYFPEEVEKIMEILEEKELRLRTPLEEVKLLQELSD